MAECIEREAMLREIERRESLMVGDKTISVDALKRFILNRPAADVAPVVYGRWVDGKCSNCCKVVKIESDRGREEQITQKPIRGATCGRG